MNSDFIAELLRRRSDVGSAVWLALWFGSHVKPGEEIAVGRMAKELRLTERRVLSQLSMLERAGIIKRESAVGQGRHSHFTVLLAEDHE